MYRIAAILWQALIVLATAIWIAIAVVILANFTMFIYEHVTTPLPVVEEQVQRK